MDSPMKSPSKRLRRKITKQMSFYLKQVHHFEQQQKKSYQLGKIDIKVIDGCKPRLVNFFGDPHTEIFSLQASPDDQYLAAGCSNGDVKVYNIYKGQLLTICNTSRMGGFPNTGVKWRPSQKAYQYTACNSDGTIKWYQKQSQHFLSHHQGDIGYLCCEYQRSKGQWCAYGKQNYQIQIYDTNTKKLKQTYIGGAVDLLNPNHTNRVFCIRSIKQDHNLFFSGGWDSTVRVWDIRIPQNSVRKFAGPNVSGDSLDYKKGQLLAGNYQNHDILQLWDFKQGQLIQTLDIGQPQKSTSYCFSACFAEKSQYNLIGCALTGSNKVKILKDKKLISQITCQAPPLSIDFYRFNDKDYLLIGGIEGTVYVVKLKIL